MTDGTAGRSYAFTLGGRQVSPAFGPLSARLDFRAARRAQRDFGSMRPLRRRFAESFRPGRGNGGCDRWKFRKPGRLPRGARKSREASALAARAREQLLFCEAQVLFCEAQARCRRGRLADGGMGSATGSGREVRRNAGARPQPRHRPCARRSGSTSVPPAPAWRERGASAARHRHRARLGCAADAPRGWAT